MDLWIIGLLGQQQIGMFLGLLEHVSAFLTLLNCASRDQQVGQVNACLIVIGLQFESAIQFLIGSCPILKLEVSLGKLVLGLRIGARIHLKRISELNLSFAILAL